ncbi:MAG: HK97 family phage prohead protease [Huintestinicola sp.]
MFNIEIRANGTLHIEGYVNAVERDSRPVICGECGKCVEQVKAGVFDKALRTAKNIDMLLNHNKSRKLASTTEGTLTLAEDSIGLRASADITDVETIEKARSGKLRGWSFGFRKLDSEIEARADKLPRRILKAIDIFEVSIVDDTHTPSYAGTSIEMRAENETEEVEVRSSEEAPEVTIEEPEPVVHNEWCEPYLRMMALEEQRFNPYHDPTNGRFTDANGGSGGFLFVGKGQKGKGTYVFERDIDSEYNKWKSSKLIESQKTKADIYNKKYATADEYKQALAQKYNGITSVDKVKTAKDVSDFINYDTQSQYYGTVRLDDGITKGYESNWKKGKVFADDVIVSDVGFSTGTTKLTIPKHSADIYKSSMDKLKKNGINIGTWYDDQNYLLMKKKGARTNKWLEGFETTRSEPDDHG